MTGNAMQNRYQNNRTASFGANPLCDKLRTKFNMGNRSVGEVALLRAITEGFNPYESAPRSLSSRLSDTSRNPRADRQRGAGGVQTASPVRQVKTGTALSASAAQRTRTKERYVKHKTPFPTGMIILVIICAVMLAFVIYSGVLINQMTREVSKLQGQAASLCAKEEEIELSLEEKNDLRVIERIATDELGMVKQDQILQKYISMSSGDRIEVYEAADEDTAGTGTTILSAISKNIGNLMEYLD